MKLFCRALLASAVVALACAGCGGSSASVNALPAAALSDVSGDYVGTLKDTTAGTLAATATLSEHGSAVGGALLLGAAGTQNIALALTLDASNALAGAGTMDTSGDACTFTVAATYDPGTNQLTGTYAPVGACLGMSGGSYTLAQQCMDPVASARRRPDGLLPHC